ncbi:methyltransferase domain-containing protein [Acinetobacter seifertii]|uniref:Methyltransferase domain-containing protein n=1 Tax=Acinetobacter seifertii TaxID=1530123 RepID=A0A7H2PXI5_9GAMM|nr:methyltransferase domain-containing protein [Acinetobacter seifertii]QNY16066.1 methyltransferase domain-containing protein [Acinetobacter seifertii]
MSFSSNFVAFIRECFRNPQKVAAISPSGKALASLITRTINHETGLILELGPGTGVFTEAMIRRGVKEEDLTLVELGTDFCNLLQKKFPKAQILHLDATEIREDSSIPNVNVIVCGLGFLNMSDDKIYKILEGSFNILKNDGSFFFFTYGPTCSIPLYILEVLQLEVTCVGKTYLNLPPATVYKITRPSSI